MASRTVQRWKPFLKWFASTVGAGLALAGSFGFRTIYAWVESRASTYTVASEIAKHAAEVGEIKRQANHGASLSDESARQLEALWGWQIAAQAELVVYRAYGGTTADPVRRGKLIQKAKDFYALEWSAQKDKHANNLAEAARLTMLVEWTGK